MAFPRYCSAAPHPPLPLGLCAFLCMPLAHQHTDLDPRLPLRLCLPCPAAVDAVREGRAVRGLSRASGGPGDPERCERCDRAGLLHGHLPCGDRRRGAKGDFWRGAACLAVLAHVGAQTRPTGRAAVDWPGRGWTDSSGLLQDFPLSEVGPTGGGGPAHLAGLPINHSSYQGPASSSCWAGRCEPQSTQQSSVLCVL